MNPKSESLANEEMLHSLQTSEAWIMFRMDQKGKIHIHSPDPLQGMGLVGTWFTQDEEMWELVKRFVEEHRKK